MPEDYPENNAAAGVVGQGSRVSRTSRTVAMAGRLRLSASRCQTRSPPARPLTKKTNVSIRNRVAVRTRARMTRLPMRKLTLPCLALLCLGAHLHADVIPAPLFTDNAVLQRDKPIPVWGTADAGENVAVSFAAIG